MSIPEQVVITIERWPESTSPPGLWQGDVAIDGVVVAGFTGPGGILEHFFQGIEILQDHLNGV